MSPSGVRSLQNVVLQPISFQRLESIGKSKRLQERLQEERRLRNLAEVTVVHISIFSPSFDFKDLLLKAINLTNRALTFTPK